MRNGKRNGSRTAGKANRADAAIVAVGTEILLGETLDTNSHWLARRITRLGGKISQIAIVPDDLTAASDHLKQTLASGVRLTLTTGGLGPTADDITLEAVAAATGRPLELHEGALAWVRARYEELFREGSVDSANLTPPRRKMALLPQGAEPLENAVGAAPGVLLPLESGQAIVCLPGVPAELKGVFESSLAPHLPEIFGSGCLRERVVTTNCRDESRLSRLLGELSREIPEVYVKSRPVRFGPDVQLEILLAASSPSGSEAVEAVLRAQAQLERALEASHIRILEAREEPLHGGAV